MGRLKIPGMMRRRKIRVEGRADLEVSQRGRKQITKRKRGIGGTESRAPQPSTAPNYPKDMSLASTHPVGKQAVCRVSLWRVRSGNEELTRATLLLPGCFKECLVKGQLVFPVLTSQRTRPKPLRETTTCRIGRKKKNCYRAADFSELTNTQAVLDTLRRLGSR